MLFDTALRDYHFCVRPVIRASVPLSATLELPRRRDGSVSGYSSSNPFTGVGWADPAATSYHGIFTLATATVLARNPCRARSPDCQPFTYIY